MSKDSQPRIDLSHSGEQQGHEGIWTNRTEVPKSPRGPPSDSTRAAPSIVSTLVTDGKPRDFRPYPNSPRSQPPNSATPSGGKYGLGTLSPQTDAIVKSQRSQRVSPAPIGERAVGNGADFSSQLWSTSSDMVFPKPDNIKLSTALQRSFSNEHSNHSQYNLFGIHHPFNEVFTSSPPPYHESRNRSGSGSSFDATRDGRSASVTSFETRETSYDTPRENRSATPLGDHGRDRSASNASFESRSVRSASISSFDADIEHDPYEYYRSIRSPDLGMRHVTIGDQTEMFDFDNYNPDHYDPADFDPSLAGGVLDPSASPFYGEHPSGEHPSRTLFVRNINSNVEDEELFSLFEIYGNIRSMYSQCKHRGFVMISYYDIRHAKNAMRCLQGKILRRRRLDIHYSIPKENPSEKDQNQGTLVIFNLDPSTSNEELKSIFNPHGEIKEIRETPNKKHHKFIEFYDVRDAEKAMRMLNKSEVKGKKIKIEPSRPGGARKGSSDWSANEDEPNMYNPYASVTEHSDSSDVDAYFTHFSPTAERSGITPATALATPFIPSSKTPTVAVAAGDRRRSGSNPPLMERSSSLNVAAASALPFIPAPQMMPSTPLSPLVLRPRSNSGNLPPPRSAVPLNTGVVQPDRALWASPETTTRATNSIPYRANSHGYLSYSTGGMPTEPKGMEGMKAGDLKPGRSRAESLEDRSKYLLNLTRVRNGEDNRTTLMIRNIPNKYTQKMLLQTVDEHHKGCYDFFYLPIDFKNKCNVGYAFINFINPSHIVSFYNEINKKKWEKFNSEKVCELTYARIQGKVALIAHFQNSSLMVEDKKCRPIIFHSGEQEPFPLGNTMKRRSMSIGEEAPGAPEP